MAPVCQRIPIRTLLRSGSGSIVTSAIRVRSSRLRSLALVVPACQRTGRSAASFQLGAAGQGRQCVLGGGQGLLGFGQDGEFGFPPGFQGAGDQAVFRFDLVEGALGPVSLVAGPFNCQPGGPADALMPAATSPAADNAKATCSGVSAASSAPATASSTQAAATVRQEGVVSRSRRELHS